MDTTTRISDTLMTLKMINGTEGVTGKNLYYNVLMLRPHRYVKNPHYPCNFRHIYITF